MSKFIIFYPGGDQPSTTEEGKQYFIKYVEWLNASGDNVRWCISKAAL
jgi:hypothetical protein